MNDLRGIIPPLVTPIDAQGEVDLRDIGRLVQHLLSGGVHGLFALGSSAEASFLSDSQRATVLSAVVAAGERKVPVLAGCIDTGARRVLGHILRAADLGADYAVVTAPFYAITCQADVESHFRWLAANSPLPLIAYNIPVCVHYHLEPEMLARLGEENIIVAVKDSSGNSGSMRRLIQLTRETGSGMKIFTGTEIVADGDLLMGADGVVPGLGNVVPQAYVDLWNAAQRGDWEEARRIQDLLEELFQIVATSPEMRGPAGALGAFKQALKHLGVLNAPFTSRPLRPLSEVSKAAVDELVDNFMNKY